MGKELKNKLEAADSGVTDYSSTKGKKTPGRSRQEMREMERRHLLDGARRRCKCVKYTKIAG